MSPDMPDDAKILTTTEWAFLHFYYMDKANACMHLAPVRFSPITFQMAEKVVDSWLPGTGDWSEELSEVWSHRGRYEVDPGR